MSRQNPLTQPRSASSPPLSWSFVKRWFGAAWLASVLVLFVLDGVTLAQTTTRVSLDSTGMQGNGASLAPSLSTDGQVVVFLSKARNLVPGDTNFSQDVFVHDRATGITTRVSVDSDGAQMNSGILGLATISADGQIVVFSSSSSNLVTGDTNSDFDVFVHDRATGITTRVSVDSAGMQGNASSTSPSLSADGQIVAFESDANNLVPGDTNNARDVFVHDRTSGITTLVSVDSAGMQGNRFGSSSRSALSADGQIVAFESEATNLVSNDLNDSIDVFVHDRATGITTRVNVNSAGRQAQGYPFHASGRPSLSADGQIVAYHSTASNLVSNDFNNWSDVFVHDRATGITTRVSVDSGGIQVNRGGSLPSLSADGRKVAFHSEANDLVPGDTSGRRSDIFVHDRAAGTTTRVSLDSAGIEGNGGSQFHALSADGQIVAFGSEATNFVPADTNGEFDVFVRDLRDAALCRSGTVNGNAGPPTDVLFVNGSPGDANRVVEIPVLAPITLSLDASPSGPSSARYIVWIWPSLPSNTLDIGVGSSLLGCTVNPTPITPQATPQPFLCLRSTRIPSAVCGGVMTGPSPTRAPWTLTKQNGHPIPADFTVQGILEDQGAANARGFSVTNAVILQVQ